MTNQLIYTSLLRHKSEKYNKLGFYWHNTNAGLKSRVASRQYLEFRSIFALK